MFFGKELGKTFVFGGILQRFLGFLRFFDVFFEKVEASGISPKRTVIGGEDPPSTIATQHSEMKVPKNIKEKMWATKNRVRLFDGRRHSPAIGFKASRGHRWCLRVSWQICFWKGRVWEEWQLRRLRKGLQMVGSRGERLIFMRKTTYIC